MENEVTRVFRDLFKESTPDDMPKVFIGQGVVYNVEDKGNLKAKGEYNLFYESIMPKNRKIEEKILIENLCLINGVQSAFRELVITKLEMDYDQIKDMYHMLRSLPTIDVGYVTYSFLLFGRLNKRYWDMVYNTYLCERGY